MQPVCFLAVDLGIVGASKQIIGRYIQKVCNFDQLVVGWFPTAKLIVLVTAFCHVEHFRHLLLGKFLTLTALFEFCGENNF